MILAGPEAPSSFHQPTSVARGKGPSGKVSQAQTTRATKAAPAMRTKQTIFIAPPRLRLKRHTLDSDQARQLVSFSVRKLWVRRRKLLRLYCWIARSIDSLASARSPFGRAY